MSPSVTLSGSHFSDAFSRMNSMRKNGGHLTDVSILFDDGSSIMAHKLVLASASKFFQTLFSNPELGAHCIIKVEATPFEMGSILVDSVYSANLPVDDDNVDCLIEGARKLGFEQIETTCNQFKLRKKETSCSEGEMLSSNEGTTANLVGVAKTPKTNKIPSKSEVHPDKPTLLIEKRKVISKKDKQVSDFDERFEFLTGFEDTLPLKLHPYILAWHKNPFLSQKIYCHKCSILIEGNYHDYVDHVWQIHKKSEEIGIPPLESASKPAPLTCGHCGGNYPTAEQLITHVRQFHNKGRSKVIINHKNKAKERMEGTPKKTATAESRPLSRSASVVKNVACPRTNLIKKKQTCSLCDKLFFTGVLLKQHMKMKHSGMKEPPKLCSYPGCNKLYSASSMRVHKLRDHQGVRYKCTDCPDSESNLFRSRTHLCRHRDKVHSQRRYRCSICFKDYFEKGAWKIHYQNVHEGKRYPCPECGKKFTSSNQVKRHVEEIHEGKRLQCAHCEKSFSQKPRLTLHVKTEHMGQYPYRCSVCDKGFLRPGILKAHLLKKHLTK